MHKIITMSLKYFTIVFITGFVLGTIRVLFIQDLMGERWAELIEMPIMLTVIILTARYLVNKYKSELNLRSSLAVGILALAILLIFEFTLVLALRNMPIGDYIASRDMVSGSAYMVSLLLFGLMPLLVFKFCKRSIARQTPN